tara:strand:- start:185 stop:580 length:396 start_codon:yes stop_codon:yes gene_type:complete
MQDLKQSRKPASRKVDMSEDIDDGETTDFKQGQGRGPLESSIDEEEAELLKEFPVPPRPTFTLSITTDLGAPTAASVGSPKMNVTPTRGGRKPLASPRAEEGRGKLPLRNFFYTRDQNRNRFIFLLSSIHF